VRLESATSSLIRHPGTAACADASPPRELAACEQTPPGTAPAMGRGRVETLVPGNCARHQGECIAELPLARPRVRRTGSIPL
jgi:hypothetical protein